MPVMKKYFVLKIGKECPFEDKGIITKWCQLSRESCPGRGKPGCKLIEVSKEVYDQIQIVR